MNNSMWQSLVFDASEAANTRLSEELESYLVFLLMRFCNNPEITNTIIALEFLNSLSLSSHNLKSTALRDVGDQCLIYSGLFPQQANRRRVRLSYFVEIGKSAYFSLATVGRYTDCDLFKNLAKHFVNLVDVLQSMRELNSDNPALDPMQAIEFWQDTGSKRALRSVNKSYKEKKTLIIDPEILSKRH